AGGDYLLSFRTQWELLAQAAREPGLHAAAREGGAGGHQPPTFEDGRRAVALALAAQRALGSGDPVEIEG
ncbi:MAG: hypothetical protein QOI32_2643, partial [Thermoleophilaceae bacterium]|nr:hypothetical protein [Thermoleophilaceae bacterium]